MRRNRLAAVFVIGAGVWAVTGGTTAAEPSDPAAGRAVFARKQCDRCHRPRGTAGAGPALEGIRRPQGAMELAGRLWNHVPAMFTTLAQDRVEWPRISAAEMADLMVYLGADSARDPAPDPARGQVTLMRKGCLKCHSFRREGGRTEPDLAQYREDYESAAAWAATMWAHSPAMAITASLRDMPYPRFSGDEMGNLLGFLRRVTSRPAEAGRAPRR